MQTLLLPFQQVKLTDRQLVTLLVGGFLLMFLGSWLGGPAVDWSSLSEPAAHVATLVDAK